MDDVAFRPGLMVFQSRRGLPSAARLLEELPALEDAGFGGLTVMDHRLDTWGDAYLRPMQFLAYAAGRTSRMALSQAVLIAAYYDPVTLAEEIATLHELSGGRVEMGLGIGWRREEFEAFGIDYDTRVARFEELVGLTRRLLPGDPVTHEGGHFSLRHVSIGWRVPDGEVPLLVGGTSRAGMRRTRRLGDGWIASVWSSEAEIADAVRYLRSLDGTEDARPLARVAVSRFTVVRRTSDEAHEIARDYLTRYVDARVGSPGHPLNDAVRAGAVDWDALRTRTVIGDVEQVVEAIRRYREIGVTDMNFRFALEGMDAEDVWTSAAVVADEVLPRL